MQAQDGQGRARDGARATIRPARPGDEAAIHQLICELAEYERSLDQVESSPDGLRAALFGPSAALFAHVAEHEGAVAGFALWFLNYSTWTGRHGIYLEDLYVRPGLRGAAGRGTARRAGRPVRRARLRPPRSGRCWTGTSQPWASTAVSARSSGATGCRTWYSGERLQRLAQRPPAATSAETGRPGRAPRPTGP